MNNLENRELDRLLTCDIQELLAAITPMSAEIRVCLTTEIGEEK